MLPEFVFENQSNVCFFFEGPFSTREFALLISMASSRKAFQVDSAICFNEDQMDLGLGGEFQEAVSLDNWLDMAERHTAGKLSTNLFAIYYEYGWELVIISIYGDVSSFVAQLKSDDLMFDNYWNLEDLVLHRKEISKSFFTSEIVQEFCNNLLLNYSRNTIVL